MAGHLGPETPVLLFAFLPHHLLHLRVRAAVIAVIGWTPLSTIAAQLFAVVTGKLTVIFIIRRTVVPVAAPPSTVGAGTGNTVRALRGPTDFITLQAYVAGGAATGQDADIATTVAGLGVWAGGTCRSCVAMDCDCGCSRRSHRIVGGQAIFCLRLTTYLFLIMV